MADCVSSPPPDPNPYFSSSSPSSPNLTTSSSKSGDSTAATITAAIENPDANTNSPPPHLSRPQPQPQPQPLVHVSFNQDSGCFAAATASGFRIFNCSPFCEIFDRYFSGIAAAFSGISAVEMLFRTNIIAIVAGGADPRFPPSKVLLWDDHANRCIGEASFRSEVRAVRLICDHVIAVVDGRVCMYTIDGMRLVHQVETAAHNPRGLCAVSEDPKTPLVLAYPADRKGCVLVESDAARKRHLIHAHTSSLACLALSRDGRLLATASTKGTLVRIYSTLDNTLLQEVRRGSDRAEIYCLAFSADTKWLAVSSDKGTVHVFSVKVDLSMTRPAPAAAPAPHAAPVSPLSYIKGVLPNYFNSEWSVAQFRLREGVKHLVAFGAQQHTIIILGMDGSFYRCEFDPLAGGEMKQLECHNFLRHDLGLKMV